MDDDTLLIVLGDYDRDNPHTYSICQALNSQHVKPFALYQTNLSIILLCIKTLPTYIAKACLRQIRQSTIHLRRYLCCSRES